jgi:catechol 2,3-dioxygenase-like lactoylglutathione lyase family enzyme
MKSKLESLSPNLIADSVNASVDFYTKHLGFSLAASVPETGNYDWAMVQRDGVTLMFQSLKSLQEDMPSLKIEKKGSVGTFFIKMKGIDDLFASVKGKLDIALEMRTTFYGMKEFGIKDPDGYYMVFAEDK